MLKKWTFVLFTLLFCSHVSADEINWLSYPEARVLDSDKPMFVFAKMRFCSSCRAMEKNALSNPDVIKLVNEHFIPVKETINFAFSSFTFDDLQDKEGNTLSFRGFPSVMVVDGQDYAIKQGYMSPEELYRALTLAVERTAS